MSSDSEHSAQIVDGIPEHDRPGLVDDVSTSGDDESIVTSSQQSIPPTDAPNSPIPPTLSPRFEDGHDEDPPTVIPSSLTPPPSSQAPNPTGAGPANPLGYLGSQRSAIFSPPATVMNGIKRESVGAEFIPPTQDQIADASIEELRSMLQACMADQARLKMEAAHHKLQYSMLSIRAEEDTKRAAVEHEMTRKEVQALQKAECARQARHDLITASESTQAKYLRLKVLHEQALEENDALHKKIKAARKVIQQKEDEIAVLTDERDMLLNRIRENREHFHLLCSPGGMFHGALTPKAQTGSPQQHRGTPRQTPRSAHRDSHRDQEGFAVLLQALSQDNNSAPSTPISGHRPAPRNPSKHTRNVQSMSSLPSTPLPRNRGDNRGHGLLPSVDLVPQTEPPYRNTRFVAEKPNLSRSQERRKSRESTISAEDNQELARQALQSFVSRGSQHSSRRRQSGGEEEEVFESQASQAASEMLRRDARESFEVASSVGNSRDGTPAAADRSAKLQAKLFGGLNKSGLSNGKRKFSGPHGGEVADGFAVHDRGVMSPTKKLREAGGLRDGGRIGLGIQYGREL